MKKTLLVTVMALFIAGVSAQETLQVAQERLNELLSLTKSELKETGNDIIDNYTDALYDLTDEVVDNGKDLNTLLENVKSGAITKASALDEAYGLSEKISVASAKAKSVLSTAKDAAAQVKSLKGLSLKALATKTLANNTKITALLGEETMNQVQTVTSLISLFVK